MQNRINSNLLNYIQTVFDQVKQSTEAYQLSLEGGISSLGTALMQYIPSIGAQITVRLDKMLRDVSGSGEGQSSQ